MRNFSARDALLTAAARRTRVASNIIGKRLEVGSRAAVPLGLVHSSTSDTSSSVIELDKNRLRAQRLKKSVITGARLHDEEAREGSRRGAWYMLTTTYAETSRPSARDISGLLKCIRSYLHRSYGQKFGGNGESLRYLWVLELTKRLRPHYHALIWVPRGVYIPHVDRKGWWPHGSTSFEKARNAVGYLAKYASKFCASAAAALPKGFRTHAVGGLSNESKRVIRWWKAPSESRIFFGPHADIRKALGGYVDKLTGVFWPSPWRVFFENGRVFLWRIES